MVQNPSIVALSDCCVHKQTATVAMHADGNGTGGLSWVLNYITISVNILWGFQYSVMCV